LCLSWLFRHCNIVSVLAIPSLSCIWPVFLEQMDNLHVCSDKGKLRVEELPQGIPRVQQPLLKKSATKSSKQQQNNAFNSKVHVFRLKFVHLKRPQTISRLLSINNQVTH
jgi:hypothetical protein